MMYGYALRWVNGSVSIYLKSGNIVLKFGNALVTLSERDIEIDGVEVSLRRYDIKDSMYLYLDSKEQLVGGEPEYYEMAEDRVDSTLGPYILSYTKVESLGYFITIQMPTGALYDYAILTPQGLIVKSKAKRRVYTMTSDKSHKVFLL